MVYEPHFKKLPFYRILTSIITTTLLGPPQRVSKYLTREFSFTVPEDYKKSFSSAGGDVNYKNIGIQLRFCRRLSNLKSSHEIDDFIPPEIEVYVNCDIPDLPPFIDFDQKQRKARPINITDLCKVSKQNQIAMSWFSSQSDNYEYFFTIHIVERTPYEEIVKSMSTTLESDSKSLVLKSIGGGDNSKVQTSSDLSVTSLTVSLLCPLGMRRIKVPSRSIYCTHVQCFDIFNYLEINEFKPNWKCPVCRDKAPFDTLIVDGLFKKILQVRKGEKEIVFAADGSWEIPSNNVLSTVDSIVEKDVCQQKSDSSSSSSSSNKPILSRPKLTSVRSSPRIKKRLTTNSPRTPPPSKSQNPSTPRSTRRKQKFPKSNPYIVEVIKDIKNGNKLTDVVDLTLDC